MASVALALGSLALIVIGLTVPGAEMRVTTIALGLGVLIAPAALAPFAALVTHFLIPRALVGGHARWRSRFALALGAAVLFLFPFVSGLILSPFSLGTWTRVVVNTACTGVLAGWVTARLAPGVRCRHALGAGVTLSLALAVLMLALGSPLQAGGAAVYLAYLPLLLLGGWLQVAGSRGSAP